MVPSVSVLTEVTGFDCNTFKKKFLNKVNPVDTDTEDTNNEVSVLTGFRKVVFDCTKASADSILNN